MSIKITVIALSGKTLSRTRARAQRLVDAGTHVWQGERTVREIKPAHQALALQDRITVTIFPPDYFYDYPVAEPHPELADLPFNYPLPYEILRHYQGA